MRKKAFGAHLAAGRRLEERNAYEESVEVFARALQLADDPGDLPVAEVAMGHAYARQGRGDEAWEHRLRAIDLFTTAGSAPPGELYADMLEIATLNWGYFQHLPDDGEVLRLLAEGERAARLSGDDVSVARLLMERAAFTNDLAGTDEIMRLIESPDAVRFADAAHRMAEVYLWNGSVARGMELYQTVFDRLIPAGAIINESEALLWYAVTALHIGDLERAGVLAERVAEDASHGSAHTRQHSVALTGLLLLVRGAWSDLTTTAQELAELVAANPDTGFCLLGAATAGYGAIADIRAGRPLPEHLDEFVAHLVEESVLVQASSVMVPKAMAGDRDAIPAGLKAYASGLRLWDRQRVWDVGDLMPAIALTMLEQWDELGPSLDRLDAFEGGGDRLAGATAAAIREEIAAARGGPEADHRELIALGCAGISELLHFRPGSAPT